MFLVVLIILKGVGVPHPQGNSCFCNLFYCATTFDITMLGGFLVLPVKFLIWKAKAV